MTPGRAPAVAARGAAEATADPDAFRHWRRAAPGPDSPESFPVGALSPQVLAALKDRGIAATSVTIHATRRSLRHALRTVKKTRGVALSNADIDRLPEMLAKPKAVLFQRHEGTRRTRARPTLLYVADSADSDRMVRVVVRIATADPKAPNVNKFVTAEYAAPDDLRDCDPLDGAFDRRICCARGRAGSSEG